MEVRVEGGTSCVRSVGQCGWTRSPRSWWGTPWGGCSATRRRCALLTLLSSWQIKNYIIRQDERINVASQSNNFVQIYKSHKKFTPLYVAKGKDCQVTVLISIEPLRFIIIRSKWIKIFKEKMSGRSSPNRTWNNKASQVIMRGLWGRLSSLCRPLVNLRQSGCIILPKDVDLSPTILRSFQKT